MPNNWARPFWNVTKPLMTQAMAVPGTHPVVGPKDNEIASDEQDRIERLGLDRDRPLVERSRRNGNGKRNHRNRHIEGGA